MALEKNQIESVKDIFKSMKRDVEILFFTSDDCEYCSVEKELLNDLAGIGRLKLTELDLKSAEAKKHGIDKAPTILFRDNPRVRFSGLPSGHEFRTFLDTIVMISEGKTGLMDNVKEMLKGIKKPVDLKVFITPMCPYCPIAVATAHQFAMENPHVTSTMYESMEFPKLSEKYGVMTVPKIVINDTVSFEGGVPPHVFAKKVLDTM